MYDKQCVFNTLFSEGRCILTAGLVPASISNNIMICIINNVYLIPYFVGVDVS